MYSVKLKLYTSVSWLRCLSENYPLFQRMRILASGYSAVEVYRLDKHSLVLKPENGFITGVLDSVYCTNKEPMQKGETIDIAGVIIHIISVTDDGRPLEVRFTFPVPLDDQSLHWLQFTENGFQPFSLPAVGEKIYTKPIPKFF